MASNRALRLVEPRPTLAEERVELRESIEEGSSLDPNGAEYSERRATIGVSNRKLLLERAGTIRKFLGRIDVALE